MKREKNLRAQRLRKDTILVTIERKGLWFAVHLTDMGAAELRDAISVALEKPSHER